MSSHSFDPHIAKDVGVNAAVLYQNIRFWVEKNEANEKHEYEGRFWMYNSIRAFKKLFIYLSDKQIRTALNRLLDKGYIDKGNFNQIGYDRTLWYCLGGHIHLPSGANGKAPKGEPIPDINPDIKPDIPPNPLPGEWVSVFEKLWKTILDLTPDEIKGRHIKKTAKEKFGKIVTRKKDPIPPARIAHAVLWYYDQEPQKKEDRKFMKGISPVLNSEAFAVYLDRGAFKIKTAESEEADAWASRANHVNRSGGEWPPSAPSARSMPSQYRDLVDKRYWTRLGWKPPQEGL